MEEIKTKIAYLKGLASGLEIDDSTKEGRLFGNIIEALEAMAEAIDQLQTDYDELFDYTEAIDEDLTALEKDYYEEESDEFEDEDGDAFTVECPNCGDTVYIDDDLLEEKDTEVLCPNCERVVFVNDDEWVDEEKDEPPLPEE